MKIFEAVDNNNIESHPYVWTLVDGMKAIDDTLEFVYGFQMFWSDDIMSCDIVHIHWPEKVLCYGKYSSEQLMARLADIKSHGIRIVSTAHNLEPHVKKTDERRNAYSIVYSMSDVIFHLGEYSMSVMKDQYPDAIHELIIHHIYDRMYRTDLSHADGLSYLGLDPDFKYLLSFGTFRTSEERKLVISVMKEIRKYGIRIIAPGIAVIPRFRKNVFVMIQSLFRHLWYRVMYPDLVICRKKVPVSALPYYYAAADVCFIHRMSILNSGNLPMALLFGKIVVGPELGNVGPQLRNLGNPSFDPTDSESVMNAVRKAFELSETKGENNRRWALENMLTSDVARRILDCYVNCCK